MLPATLPKLPSLIALTVTKRPVEIFGCLTVKERVKKHIAAYFVDAITEEIEICTKPSEDDQERRKTVEDLGKMLECEMNRCPPHCARVQRAGCWYTEDM